MTDDERAQRKMCEDAELAPARRYHAFMGIMQGPNPLTDAELIALAEKYPDRYGFFRAYVGKFTKPPRGCPGERAVMHTVTLQTNVNVAPAEQDRARLYGSHGPFHKITLTAVVGYTSLPELGISIREDGLPSDIYTSTQGIEADITKAFWAALERGGTVEEATQEATAAWLAGARSKVIARAAQKELEAAEEKARPMQRDLRELAERRYNEALAQRKAEEEAKEAKEVEKRRIEQTLLLAADAELLAAQHTEELADHALVSGAIWEHLAGDAARDPYIKLSGDQYEKVEVDDSPTLTPEEYEDLCTLRAAVKDTLKPIDGVPEVTVEVSGLRVATLVATDEDETEIDRRASAIVTYKCGPCAWGRRVKLNG